MQSTLNQGLCGFNFTVIFLIILVAFILILIIVRLRCHIENLSIEDTLMLDVINVRQFVIILSKLCNYQYLFFITV